jgi:hypothetical protein
LLPVGQFVVTEGRNIYFGEEQGTKFWVGREGNITENSTSYLRKPTDGHRTNNVTGIVSYCRQVA